MADCERQQFGLSSVHRNKTFIFVKLTDSALKAIDEYLQLKENALVSKPCIQFHSNTNQGTLCFPNASSDSNGETERRFSFNLSNVDADGPQGSFECIRQTRRGKTMESLGSMQYKMQIHASEDSYQKTKARMAVAEQESKKNCTKVIKDSGPNVGRKVKVKKVFSHHQPGLPHYSHSTRPNSPPTLKLNGSCITNKSSLANKASPISNQANSDIVRRPLKERMIHLLAVRPYKKPELMLRLNKDGLKEKDKKGMSAVLNQIATLKDNVYHLARHAWHEVQMDEWPFYTTEERDMIRKKNPLLTVQTQHSSALNTLSPLSSDCSSLQDSPSPPNLMNLNVNSPSSHPAKRAIESASSNLKRQRIAHSNPPPPPPQAYSRAKSPNANLQTSGYGDVLNGWANKPKSPENAKNGVPTTKNGVIGNLWNYSNGTSDLRPELQLSSNKSLNYLSPDSNGIVQQSQSANQSVTTHLTNGFSNNAISNESKKVAKNGHVYRNGSGALNVPQNLVSVNAYTNGSTCSTPNSSPDSGTGSNDGSLSTTSTRSLPSTNEETRDFLLKYVEITSDAQRAKYKSDFNFEYGEYRTLHRQLDAVAKRFTDLESELRNHPEGSDEWNVSVDSVADVTDSVSQRIMDKIMDEYAETKRDAKYNEVKKRVAYLHEKLSHIKKLVYNYDKLFRNNVKRAVRSKKSKRLTS